MNKKTINDYRSQFSIVLTTSDNYISLLDGFFYFLDFNWPVNPFTIYVSLEKKIYHGPNNVNFVNTPSSDWSKRLYETLKFVDTDYIILLLDDYWITEKIHEETLNKVLDFSIKNEINFISYSKISNSNSIYEIFESEDIKFYCAKNHIPNNEYLLEANGIYNKSFLMKFLRKNESAWEFENNASYRMLKSSIHGNYRFFSNNNPIPYLPGGIIHKGELTREASEVLKSYNYEFFWNKKSVIVSTESTPILIRGLRKIIRIPKRILSLYFFKFK